MPVKHCIRNGKPGYKWGDQGYCYLISEEGGAEQARQKAQEQGRAIEVRKNFVSKLIHSKRKRTQ